MRLAGFKWFVLDVILVGLAVYDFIMGSDSRRLNSFVVLRIVRSGSVVKTLSWHLNPRLFFRL